MKQIHLLVKGRVQGVGFRESVRRAAHAEKVVGWVKNRPDGSVEVLLQGEEGAVEKVVKFVRDGGPALARVEGVEETTPSSTENFSKFTIER